MMDGFPRKSEVARGQDGWEICYVGSNDCGPFAGVYLNGGIPKNVSGSLVVKFRQANVKGKWLSPVIKVEGRPDLQQLVDEYQAAREAELKVEAWRPDGFADLEIALHDYETALEQWYQSGRRVPGGKPRDTAIEQLREQHPAAALFQDSLVLQNKAANPDPTGRVNAAKECQRIIRETGDLEAAREALAKRRAGFVD